MAPFFNLPSPFEREKLSIAMASSSAIYYPPSIPPLPQTHCHSERRAAAFAARSRGICFFQKNAETSDKEKSENV